MRRREQRKYLVATGLAVGVSILLVIVVLLMPGGSSPASQFSSLVWDHDAAAVVDDSTEHPPIGDLTRTRQAARAPETVGSDPLAVPPAAEVANVGGATSESSAAQLAEWSGPAAGASDRGAAGSYSTSPAAGQSAAWSNRGFAQPPAAFVGGGGAGTAAASGGDSTVEPVPSDAEAQTAHVSDTSTGDPDSASDSSAGGSSSPSVDALAPSTPLDASGEGNASLVSKVLEDLTESSSILDPIVLSSPDTLSELVSPAAPLEGLEEPSAVDALASDAGVELMAPLGLPTAPLAASVDATSPAPPRVVNPEPASLLLLGTGLGLAAHLTRRRRPRTDRTDPA